MSAPAATAATIVPQNVEKLPLFHWRPGARLLAVGSRDGADFAGDPTADRNTYQRPVEAGTLVEAQAKLGLDGLAATWSTSLDQTAGMDTLLAARRGALVVATPGIGDAALLARLLPEVDAWLLLIGRTPGPLDRTILEHGRHVEALIGLDETVAIPDLPWERAVAVHLCALRTAEADRLDAWCAQARPVLPVGVPVYDHHHPHTDCRSCGERIVWRHGGRSRIDAAVDGGRLRCGRCHRPADVVV